MHRLIIDTDPGEDDALAIMMAAAHPNAHIEALTAVMGNVGLSFTSNNCGVILDVLGLDVPIYAGCDRPLVMEHFDASYAHGDVGLGNTGMTSERKIEEGHASAEIVRRANAEPGELTLVTLGSYTNIATALMLDPNLPKKLKRTVSMAGAVSAHGNVNVCAEFNVYADPEAAHAVFEAWARCGEKIEVVDWEVTMRQGFPQELRADWEAVGTAKSDFFAAISRHSNDFIIKHRARTTQFFADPVAMAVVLEPEIVEKQESHYLAVETQGRVTRGQTVVDWDDRSEKPINADVILSMNQARLEALIMQALQ